MPCMSVYCTVWICTLFFCIYLPYSFCWLCLLSFNFPPIFFSVSFVSLSFSILVIGSLFILFLDNFICILGHNYYIHASVYCSTASLPHSSLFNFSTSNRHAHTTGDFNLHPTVYPVAYEHCIEHLKSCLYSAIKTLVFSRGLCSALYHFSL